MRPHERLSQGGGGEGDKYRQASFVKVHLVWDTRVCPQFSFGSFGCDGMTAVGGFLGAPTFLSLDNKNRKLNECCSDNFTENGACSPDRTGLCSPWQLNVLHV